MWVRDNLEEIQQKVTHLNYAQQKAIIVATNIIVAIIGRGGGKTHGFIAPAVMRNVQAFPRGGTGMVGPTYIKLENDLIPALRKALERFNLYEDIDYWIGRFIPKNIDHAKPFECPSEPKYSIFFRNGHVLRIIGLDRKDSGNAQSNDFVIGDEAKFINQSAFNSRVVPTNRGNEDLPAFTQHAFHHGILFCTDMPTSPESQWLFEYEKMMDPEEIDLIVSFDMARRALISDMVDELMATTPGLPQQIKFDKELLLQQMRDLVAQGKLTDRIERNFRKELTRIDDILFELRREAVYFIEASTLENLDVVTERYLRQMKRVLTPEQFDRSILGLRKLGADFAFYGNFDEVKHTYSDINYDYTDNYTGKELPQPWRKDADLDISRGLDLACDWGAKINCAVLGQEFRHAFRILNNFYVLKPLQIKHLVKKVDDYYTGYPRKLINHIHDHTALKGNGQTGNTDAEDLLAEFTYLGWTVVETYIGQAAGHESRYKLFGKMYGDSPDIKRIEINRNNCPELIKSMNDAGVYEDDKGHRKDKRPERLESVPPQHATHLSDAHDTLIIGAFQSRLSSEDYEPDYSI